MVSAPTGRVCKKNAQVVPITTKIRIVIHSTVVPLSNASSIPLSTSCRCTQQAFCCISRRLSVVLVAHACRFIVHPLSAFCFFLSYDVVAPPRRSSWHRIWHSSLTRQCWETIKKKLHRPIKNFHPCVQ